jgi:5-formyltetrahydrofolate cyclo-ligase
MNSDEKKEIIRKEKKILVQGIGKDFRESSRRSIQSSVCSIPEVRSANVICVYRTKDNEVDTSGIFRSLWKKGNVVVLAPRIREDTLEACQVHNAEDFVDGPYGLKEPSQQIVPFAGNIDVVIVPGLAFDVHGVRLGRGKGYYDRFLKTTHAYAIGLAYDFQVVEHIPENAFDKRMDLIITEKRCMTVG